MAATETEITRRGFFLLAAVTGSMPLAGLAGGTPPSALAGGGFSARRWA